MEVSNLLAQESISFAAKQTSAMPVQEQQPQHAPHQYSTRQSLSSGATASHANDDRFTTPPIRATGRTSTTSTPFNMSPQSSIELKDVAFELLSPESPNHCARRRMRVKIRPDDDTESIITTVKNFYGLCDGDGVTRGVSFEDHAGNTLIARYQNFTNGMSVYVRVVEEPGSPSALGPPPFTAQSPGKVGGGLQNGAALSMAPPQPAQALTYGSDRKLSMSPRSGRGRSSDSVGLGNVSGKKHHSRLGVKSGTSSAHGSAADANNEAANGFSDSDGGHASVSSSRKAKADHLASAEISLDNIVEGGRRKRAKFESSELPLFVPPQVPLTASTSSASPARGADGQHRPPPFAHPSQRTFAYPQPLYSPQSLGPNEPSSAYSQPASARATPPDASHRHHLRNRASSIFPASRQSNGAGSAHNGPDILPTPDPTVASCISDEDVAIQLMRLGDTSNISNGTRKSASTADDGFSGIADAASSSGATSEAEPDTDATEHAALPRSVHPQAESSPIPIPGASKRKRKTLNEILPSFDSTEPSGDEGIQTAAGRAGIEGSKTGVNSAGSTIPHDGSMKEMAQVLQSKASKSKPAVLNGVNKARSGASSTKSNKSRPRPAGSSKTKAKNANANSKSHGSTSSGVHSRKASSASTINFQHHLGTDEEDLSSKPRCQRCRKSKKGCDRQRPCQRCKDAGIGIEGCISEDEGNGRKGRFGRHMGVVIKKPTPSIASTDAGQDHPKNEYLHDTLSHASAPISATAPTIAASSADTDAIGPMEKSRKRKR